jgi:UDP-N-acetylmuramate: L-alanyl-gamma-D-glutamyl-meso-diaminopimelate ligase
MKVHFIAIGGSIMHSLASAMKKAGNQVSGSDDEIYEPSRSRLAAAGLLPPFMGWHPERITPDLEIVVLGMHARADNPELIKAGDMGLNIESFPEFMYRLSREKLRIVVTGSHGKTTTSGMIAHILDRIGVPADRMIGASIGNLEPVSISDARIIVLEGDEYLSSPIDPRPKFLHYDPDITIITGIAWDHMNVFPTYAQYVDSFRKLINSLRPESLLIYSAEDEELVRLVEEERPPCRRIPYSAFPYSIIDGKAIARASNGRTFPLAIFGKHNLQNLAAALLACSELVSDEEKILEAIQTFTGANKRLQLLYQNEAITAYMDFAHAPSKVKATIDAVREKHGWATLIACLELHTFSSLNPDFLPLYKDVMKNADYKLVFFSPHTLEIKKLPALSADQLAIHFNAPDLLVVQSEHELEQQVTGLAVKSPVVILWMSSGRFNGAHLQDIQPSMV